MSDESDSSRTVSIPTPGRQFRATYAMSLLLLVAVWLAPMAAAGGFTQTSSVSVGDEAAPVESEYGVSLIEHRGPRTEVRDYVRVAIALDEEWRDEFGDDASWTARSLLSAASGRFRADHIQLIPVRVVDWASPAGLSAAELMDNLIDSVSADGADIVIGLTAQTLEGAEDGYSKIGGTHAVVRFHKDDPLRDQMVLSHEIGHLFGATHGCDIEEREGLMASEGFAEPDLICPGTDRILELNANRFGRHTP